MAGQISLVYGVDSAMNNQNSVSVRDNKRVHSSSSYSSPKPMDSFFLSESSPFLGTRSMFSFEDGNGGKGSGRSVFNLYDQEEIGDDEYDDYFHQPEKKRRLKADQVQFLEKSFETENKLEPERKIQLAKELGLQPRQIAIWFQNRRARWKTKQLEKDYDLLHDSYNQLKANYDNLLQEKNKLKDEVLRLSNELLLKETPKDNIETLDTETSSEAPHQERIADLAYEEEVFQVSMFHPEQDDRNAVISDSDSPRYADWAHDSSYVFEQDQSDVSQDEDNFSNSILPSLAYNYANNADEDCYGPPENSCPFGLPSDEESFGFWSY